MLSILVQYEQYIFVYFITNITNVNVTDIGSECNTGPEYNEYSFATWVPKKCDH